METMQPALKNGRNVWDRINMPKEEFDGRIGRVRAGMRERGIDLLLVYSRGLNNYGDAAYLTNFIIRLPRGTLVALPLAGEPAVFFEGGSRGIPSLQMTMAAGELKAASLLAKDCGKYLREKKWVPTTVGLAGLKGQMPFQQFRNLMGELEGCSIKEADDLIAGFRAEKSRLEIDEIRRAARIVGQLVAFLKESGFEGAGERTVEALLFRTARLEGAEDVRLLIAKPGDTNHAFRPLDDAPVFKGERIVFSLAVEYERYWAEAMRTFLFNGASFAEEPDNGLAAAYRELCDAAKPGVEIQTLARKAASLMGEKAMEAIYPYGLGCGIGLGHQEAPLLTEENQGKLKEGMTLSLRIASGRGNGFSVMGNTVLVAEGGGIILSVEPVK